MYENRKVQKMISFLSKVTCFVALLCMSACGGGIRGTGTSEVTGVVRSSTTGEVLSEIQVEATSFSELGEMLDTDIGITNQLGVYALTLEKTGREVLITIRNQTFEDELQRITVPVDFESAEIDIRVAEDGTGEIERAEFLKRRPIEESGNEGRPEEVEEGAGASRPPGSGNPESGEGRPNDSGGGSDSSDPQSGDSEGGERPEREPEEGKRSDDLKSSRGNANMSREES